MKNEKYHDIFKMYHDAIYQNINIISTPLFRSYSANCKRKFILGFMQGHKSPHGKLSVCLIDVDPNRKRT